MIARFDKIARELRAHRYYRTPEGIMLPDLRTLLQGFFTVRGRAHRNLITDEGIALIAADTFPTNLYTALWENDVTPSAAWTGASFDGTAGEITSTTDGYVEATRPEMTNLNGAAPCEFNMRSTGAPIVVYGIALLDGSTRGSTTDNLFSALRFTAGSESFDDHDILDVRYTLLPTPA